MVEIFAFARADNSVLHSLTDNYSRLLLHTLFCVLLSFFPTLLLNPFLSFDNFLFLLISLTGLIF